MELKEKERTALEDLQTQEKSCIDKYELYANQANDSVLKDLFNDLAQKEQKHYDSITSVLNGEEVPQSNCNCEDGGNYEPKATYSCGEESEEKTKDCFLATDCIASEKLVSGEYNTNVFIFENAGIRKLLADILVEEQNHAQMLWKYKMANCMA